MKRSRVIKYLYVIMFIVLYGLSILAYMYGGEKWYDAGYYSAQLFFMTYTVPTKENVLLFVCRVMCPLMTITGLFAVMINLFHVISDFFISFQKNATAIYGDAEQTYEMGRVFYRPVFMGTKVNKFAKSHVLIFRDDIDNLNFHEQIKEKLNRDSKVFIKLEETDSHLLTNSDAHYFNINEMIARTYWKNRNLSKYLCNGKLEVRIAIIGFDVLGQKILDYGLMNNIYSLGQKIHYHIWGESILYQNLIGKFDMMNGDEITYHNLDWREEIDQLRGFDRIIVAEENNIEVLQSLLYLNSSTEIDFYNPVGKSLAKIYMENKLNGFGDWREVLTEENIKTDKLYREAKKINYNYVVKYDKTGTYTWTISNLEKVMEIEWNKLSGFKKGSNIACADYHEIRLLVMNVLGWNIESLTEEQEEILAEMEHVRWSRYHYVNHWHYSEERDDSRRLHHLLIPYKSLPYDEKQKDLNAIYELFVER